MNADSYGDALDCTLKEITKLHKTIAAQAAVIEKLREALSVVMWFVPNHPTVPENKRRFDILKEALAIPTDSTQALDVVRRAERERCAKVCEDRSEHYHGCYMGEEATGASSCAAAILAME